MDIFARAPDGNLLHKFFEGAWGPNGMVGPLEIVGTGIAGDPAVVSWGPGRLDIFARAANGDLLHKFFEGAWKSPRYGRPARGRGYRHRG